MDAQHKVLRTAGGTGVGAENSTSLHETGFKVSITGRTGSTLNQMCKRHAGVMQFLSDVTDADHISRLFKFSGRSISLLQIEVLPKAIENIVAKTPISEENAILSLRIINPQIRFVEPEEVAACVHLLCTDGSASTTGRALSISGGEI